MLGAFAALAIVSVGLKAAAGQPDDGGGATASQVEKQLASKLSGQGFSTSISHREFVSSVVQATRGNCRLIVRDARGGAAFASVFARDASGLGPLRYLYQGQVSDAPPSAEAWLDRFENKITNRLGIQRRIPVPVALATSPGCEGQNFGLTDFRA
jgi:hypothetical protein